MSTPASLPVPRLQLVQVGQWRAPRFDFSTQLKPEVKEALTEMYRGPVFNHDANRRADLQPVRVTHEGAYHCCGHPRSCTWAMSDWDGIVRSLGVAKTPILFYRNPYCLDCPSGCNCESLYTGAPCYHCLRKNPCGEWLWAWGTVTSVENNLTMDDFRSPTTATTSFEVRLEGPLQLATHRRWVYANKIPITGPCVTTEEAAARILVEKSLFVPPCGPGDCCARAKFWPRNLDAILCDNCLLECDFSFNPLFWDARYRWEIFSDTCFSLFVPGHVPPYLRTILSNAGGSVMVRNGLGSTTYSYATTGQIFTDTSTGLVYRNYTGSWVLQPAALDVVRLEPGENVITTINTSVTLGITPYWID